MAKIDDVIELIKGMTILELDGNRIKAWNAFLDTERLFPLFGLPLTLPS